MALWILALAVLSAQRNEDVVPADPKGCMFLQKKELMNLIKGKSLGIIAPNGKISHSYYFRNDKFSTLYSTISLPTTNSYLVKDNLICVAGESNCFQICEKKRMFYWAIYRSHPRIFLRVQIE